VRFTKFGALLLSFYSFANNTLIMANIFDSAKENSLLKDERFLYQDFVPEELPFRDTEIGEMVFCLKPASEGKKPTNLFLHGVPGTGKTVSSKYVLNELAEYSDRAKALYINCFEINSKHSILTKITNFVGYPIPERGLSSEEIFDRFVSTIKNKKLMPVFVFDEAEQLLKNEDAKSLLYDLSRLSERHQIFAGLIFISNENTFLASLDDRVRSSLQASTLEFAKYSSLQLKDILKERAKFSFFPNVLDDEVIPLCAAHASKKGDARIAIDVLLKAARLAEKENAKKVAVKHVRSAFMQEKPIKVEITSNLSEPEQVVLDFIKEGEFSVGDIYVGLKDKYAERTLRKAFASLEEKKMIQTITTQSGKGSARTIKRA
jgi:archaeal cell division control protein 6